MKCCSVFLFQCFYTEQEIVEFLVRTRHGGGTRHLSSQKTVTMEELLETGKKMGIQLKFSPC